MGHTACTEPQCLYRGALYVLPFLPCHHGIHLRILTLRVFSSVWGQICVCIFLVRHWNLHLYNQGHISTVPYFILHFTMNCYLIFFHKALILFLITDEWMIAFDNPCVWVFHHREVHLSVICGIGILMISSCFPQYLYKIKNSSNWNW